MEDETIITLTEGNRLIDVCERGDFVDYPVSYENVVDSYGDKSTCEGWRVLGIENDCIKLISSGIPISFWQPQVAIASKNAKMLREKFLNIPVKRRKNSFYDVGFDDIKYGETLKKIFNNPYTNIARALSVEDISEIVGEKLEIASNVRYYDGLFDVGSLYYLASNCGISDLFLVNAKGKVYFRSGFIDGIRIVVYLKPDVMTNGIKDGKWQVYMPY